jgi:hypothetical protein
MIGTIASSEAVRRRPTRILLQSAAAQLPQRIDDRPFGRRRRADGERHRIVTRPCSPRVRAEASSRVASG